MSESSSQDDEQLEKMNARMERRRSRDSVCSPEFQQELRNHEVTEGDTVYLTIKVTGIPEPEVTWYKNGEQLKEDTRVKFITETGAYSLLINIAAVEDEGEYRCVASNMGGSVACQSRLTVKGETTVSNSVSQLQNDNVYKILIFCSNTTFSMKPVVE